MTEVPHPAVLDLKPGRLIWVGAKRNPTPQLWRMESNDRMTHIYDSQRNKLMGWAREITSSRYAITTDYQVAVVPENRTAGYEMLIRYRQLHRLAKRAKEAMP